MTTENLTLKRRLMTAIKLTADGKSMTQKDLALALDTTQPRVSNLFQMQTEKFSLDSLFSYAYTLDIDVTVNIGE